MVVEDDPGEFEIRPAPEQTPGPLFVADPEGKTGKNRWHPDFVPEDKAQEVERLLALGARRADPAHRAMKRVLMLTRAVPRRV